MLHKLVFDTTDVNTIADSHNVGAYIRSSDGSLISSGDGSSDNVANTFEGLDTRGFMFGYDSVGGNWDRIQQISGAMKVYIDDGDFEVDVVINAEKAEDAAHSSGDVGNYVLAVRQDTLATDTSATGDYASFKVNALGALYVNDPAAIALLTTIDADTGSIASNASSIASDTAALVVDLAAIEVELLDQGTTLDSILSDTSALVVDLAAIEVELLDQGTTLDSILADTANIDTNVGSIDSTLTALSKAEDAVHSSGDQGIMSLAVRNDTLASLVSADGDYAPLQVDANGALYTYISGSDPLTVNDAALANTAITAARVLLTAADTAEDVVASPLSNRKYLFIYNNDGRNMYIGPTGVSATSGFPLPPGSMIPLRAGAAIDIEWVSNKEDHDLRYMELS